MLSFNAASRALARVCSATSFRNSSGGAPQALSSSSVVGLASFSRTGTNARKHGLMSEERASVSFPRNSAQRPNAAWNHGVTNYYSTTAKIPSHEQQYEEQRKRNEDAGVMTELVRDFLEPSAFYKAVKEIGIDFYTGVPDSLLKDFCAFVTDHVPSSHHIIAPNEGAAVAVAAGYHLASSKSTASLYAELWVSLCAPEVYSIPMLLLIGWRGEPAALGIPFQPLPDYFEGAQQALYTAKKHLERTLTPYALLVKRQTFAPYKMQKPTILDETEHSRMPREDAIETVISTVSDKDIIVGTTGMLSRELFELRKMREEGHERDFLTVGCMGHATSIALGIAVRKPTRRIFALDGDGALIMHMGSMATIAQTSPPNLTHIVLNNGAHDSVGGQPSAASKDTFSIPDMAIAAGYRTAQVATNKEEIIQAIRNVQLPGERGPNMIEIKIRRGSRKDLGRPTRTPVQNKMDFMHFLAINTSR
ncbi:Phosphonopyruvate decarboxylase [Orchesella cincta]|uniref:2-hydroxyacyl-CoA lyase 2 n=1 Tax=Orchesella cincta TaxID=48709 RepID=A0A1D2N3S9_ORCCI|nr:Phosphonopyruvate decarboxylase [Orchesella cincta]